MNTEFEILLLKKEILELKYGADRGKLSVRYNPWHNPRNGRFQSKYGMDGGGPVKTPGKANATRRSSQSRKPLRVSEKEYAIICDSISRNYDARYKENVGKGNSEVTTADYQYQIEIRGSHDFTIWGRRKLK